MQELNQINVAAFQEEQAAVLRQIAENNARPKPSNQNKDAVRQLFLAIGEGAGLPREAAALLANRIVTLEADVAELKAAMQLPHMSGVEKRKR